MKSIKPAIRLLLAVAALLPLFGCQMPPTSEQEEPAHAFLVPQERAGDELGSLSHTMTRMPCGLT